MLLNNWAIFPNIAAKVEAMSKMYWLSAIILVLLFAACNSTSEPAKNSEVAKQKPKAEQVDKPNAEKPKERWPKRGEIKEYFTEYGKANPETHVMLKTSFGNIELELFEDTPLHRANFIHHIKRGLYERTVFYRVAPDFVIQGGNSDHDKTNERRKKVDSYYIPNEVKPHHFHQRGALAAAMNYQNNPENNSSQYDWYIVIGKTFSADLLDATAKEYNMDIPDDHRSVYIEKGGAPHLDGKHTVFGRVISGMDVVEEISKVRRDGSDWPFNDIIIDYEILD